MPAGLTSAIVVNAALEQIASQTAITSLTDGTPAAIAASVVYAPTVQLLLRELDPAFARFSAALTLSAAFPPEPPWAYEYVYPTDCVRLRQIRPPAAPAVGAADSNDPVPIRFNVAMDIIAAAPAKVILTNQINAWAAYTSSRATEVQWDSAFTDTVVRRLANPLAMALSGRPDFAKEILGQAAAMAKTAEAVDEGGFRVF